MAGRRTKGATGSAAPQRADTAGAPVQLFFGGDEYLVAKAARKAVDALCPPEEQTLGVEEVDGRAENAEQAAAALRRCVAAVRTPSLLGGRKVVWLRDAGFLGALPLLKAATVEPWAAELAALLRSGLPPGHALVISAPAADKRTALFKALRAAGTVSEFAVPDKVYLAEREAGERAREAFRAAGLRAGEDVIDALLARTGADTRLIVQEVEKLAVYLGGGTTPTVEDVRAVAAASRDAIGWDYADAVGSRDTAAALGLMRQLLFQGVNGMVLVGTLEGRFRDLMVVRSCLDRRWLSVAGRTPSWRTGAEIDEVLGALGGRDPRKQHPYRTAVLAEQAAGYRRGFIERAREEIVRTREAMVSGFADPEQLLAFLTVRLTAGGRRS